MNSSLFLAFSGAQWLLKTKLSPDDGLKRREKYIISGQSEFKRTTVVWVYQSIVDLVRADQRSRFAANVLIIYTIWSSWREEELNNCHFKATIFCAVLLWIAISNFKIHHFKIRQLCWLWLFPLTFSIMWPWKQACLLWEQIVRLRCSLRHWKCLQKKAEQRPSLLSSTVASSLDKVLLVTWNHSAWAVSVTLTTEAPTDDPYHFFLFADPKHHPIRDSETLIASASNLSTFTNFISSNKCAALYYLPLNIGNTVKLEDTPIMSHDSVMQWWPRRRQH